MKHFYPQFLMSRAIVSLLFAFSPMFLWAQSYTQNNVNYYIDGSTAYVGTSSEATGDVTILDKITVDGTEYPVTRINTYAFANNENLTAVNFPNTLTVIGRYAFSACTGLTTLKIPNSVTTLEDRSFRDCSGLLTVTIGSGVTTIDHDSFYNCENVTDVYMFADPETLYWHDGEYDDFKPDGSTIVHVENAAPWVAKFTGEVHAIFRDA